MKILVASVPAEGHFNPLTGPAVAMAERGHEVRWYAGPLYAPKVERLGLTVVPYDRAVEIAAENLDDLYPQRARLKGPKLISFDADKLFAAAVLDQFHDIRDAREEFPFDVMLYEGAFYPAYLVAKRLGVPVVGLGSIAAPSLRHPDDVPPFFGLRPARNPVERIRQAVVRRMVLSATRASTSTFNSYLAAEGLPPIAVDEFMDCTLQPDVAVKTFWIGLPELDYPDTKLPAKATWAGAVLPHSSGPKAAIDPRITAWPGQVVVVSQGTVDNHDLQKLMAPTIEALSGSGRLVVVATGGIGTEALRARYPRDDVIVEDYIDFRELFPHTDLFVTNGGMGSVLLALSHGVPLVVAGTREGKNDINARLAHNGLAVDLRTERPRAHQIQQAAQRVLGDQDMLDRVRQIKARLGAVDSTGLIERGLTELAVHG